MNPGGHNLFFRRLVVALALLAVLALGLHETAHAAGEFGGAWQAVADAQLDAAPGISKGAKPDKHHGAHPHSCHVCGAVMPTASAQPVFPPHVAVLVEPAILSGLTGLDPGRLHRPPRASVIA